MWGGGKARFLSAAECFPLARGRPNRRGAPLLGRCPPQVSEGGRQGCSPQQSCRGLPAGLALGQERDWDWPSSAWLRLPAPPPPGHYLSPLSRKEPGRKFPFSNPIFTRGVDQMSPLPKTPKCKATKWYSKFRSCATLGPEELRSYLPC